MPILRQPADGGHVVEHDEHADPAMIGIAQGGAIFTLADLAFAAASSSDETVPAGLPSRDTRAVPADNARR